MAGPRYEPADFFLLRAPALPAGVFQDLLATSTEDPEQARAEVRQRLHALAAQPAVRRALTIASGDLVDALDRAGESAPAGKRARRLHSRLLRYLIRMTTRPTPFGAFSGVAVGEFGPETTACLGESALRDNRIRADMAWLLTLIKQLESDEQLRPHLRVVLNSSVHRSGDRLVLPYADIYGHNDNRAVRVRATTAALAVTRLAATPIPLAQLLAGLAEEFPGVDPARVSGLVEELRTLNFLTSDLRPPLTVAQPEAQLAKQLAGIEAAGEAAEALREVINLAHRAATEPDPAALAELTAAQRALTPEHTGPTYQLDATLDLPRTRLSGAVGEAVAEAVDCLMRLSAALPGHNHHLAQYRDAFTERYGLLALVPVLELLSPEHGLDAPPTYTEPPRGYPLPHNVQEPWQQDFDKVLTEFAVQAWCAGDHEIELTDEWLNRFAPPEDAPPLALYPALDVFAQISTDRSVDSGEWRAVLRQEGLAFGGRTSGRFFDLLGEDAVDRLRGYARREEELSPEVVYAELCYLPNHGRAANVALRPLLRGYEVPVNTTPSVPPERVIDLADLCVGANEDRFFLWSRRLGKQVVVSQNHMLSPHVAPNVARFVLEVSNDGYAMPCGFRWGPLETMPFLPRVTRGKVVLRPAQWNLTSLPGKDFPAEVRAWRERWRVPRHVYLVEADNRLLLDLDHPMCLDELATELNRGPEPVTVHEMLPAFDQQWLRDAEGAAYLEEIVVPLIARNSADTARSEVTLTAPTAAAPEIIRQHLPGGQWTFLKLYAGITQQDEVIATRLRELVAMLREQGLIDRWFYIRYMDPRPHLRLRFRAADPEVAPQLLWYLTVWSGQLAEEGLAFDTAIAGYTPEIERYGGPPVFDTVEPLFAANSDVTADLVTLLHNDKDGIRPEFAAIAAVDTLYRQWGLTPRERMELLPNSGGADAEAARTEFQQQRAYLTELLVPWDYRPHEQGRAHHEMINEILAPQQEAVAAAAHAVREAAAVGVLWGAESSVLGSLAHMQINRLLPIDLRRESHLYAVWRQALRAIGGRPAPEAKA
ncbi:lantibiotic dehydratase [Crossiella cryophila]|uniref:Thiopeptide-type bacteriocin biosynthesis protein n=1 Tax=Crossiella cryophila TaxID=43355 RepID=A0A7W7CIT7_9PSEU|nr:lantibiotic dehydratase [Crossiella cryophila]MBB4680224.1 thiopeptide-type bacteriocin biosynthesis protein [Crossiella cryophila]